MSLEILLLIGIVAGVIGYRVANGKGRDGLVWGVLCFFIPILVLVVLVIGPGSGVPEGYRRCPHCAELIHKAATCAATAEARSRQRSRAQAMQRALARTVAQTWTTARAFACRVARACRSRGGA